MAHTIRVIVHLFIYSTRGKPEGLLFYNRPQSGHKVKFSHNFFGVVGKVNMRVCVAYPDRGKWVPPRTAWVGRAPCHPAAYRGTAAPRPGTRCGRAALVGPPSCNEAPMNCTPTAGKSPETNKTRQNS